MVKERDPSRTSSGLYLSPQKPERPPLANISAKMQSPSPKQRDGDDAQDAAHPKSAPQAPEFGKASPLRNPLKKQEPSLFMPRNKPAQQKPSPNRQFMSSAAQQAQAQAQRGAGYVPAAQRGFYVPGQASGLAAPEQQGQAQGAAQRGFYMPGQASVPSASQHQGHTPAGAMHDPTTQRGFYLPGQAPYPPARAPPNPVSTHSDGRGAYEVPIPSNAPRPSVQPPPKPQFSSLGAKTFFQPFHPPRQVVDLTKKADDDEDGFDPDAAIRAESDNFGTADPYMYVDSAQANENIKNLLEGAFDDDENKSKTRLRKRAKKAVQEGKDLEAKSLANKLAALNVQDEEKQEPEPGKEEEEEEDGTVEGLVVKLLPHQVEGVSWMIDKETGARKRNGVLPNGGILADDMGLGKTVQTVALMLTNPRPAPGAKPDHPKQKLPGKDVGKGTLVVAPLALIRQWEDEIKTKVTRSHALRVLVHHGASRTKSASELKKYDIVITTYQTLTSEHAGSNMGVEGGARIGCFGVHWYRIVLDEAHSIKNRNAKSTLACCALNSWYRWCLTGTPMQNNLDELQSLIKFLRIKPYCELPNWKEQITGPMKNGRGGLAMKRLQFFLKAFMKRRTKDILNKEGALNFGGTASATEKEGQKPTNGGMQIVKREVLTVECDFDEQEQELYIRLQERADRRLKEMAQEGQKTDYIGALVLLLRLRQACNHSNLIEMAMNKDKDAMTTGTSTQIGSQTPRKQNATADGGMDDLTAMMGGISVEAKNCDVCQVDLSAARARSGAVRCEECDADLLMMKKGKKKEKVKKEKAAAPSRRKQHKLPDDSDEEGEGEWIGEGSEQHIDLGKAGGTDDEDAEGGGDTLGSVDSERSSDDDEEEDDEDSATSDDDSDRQVEAPVMRHRVHGNLPKHKPSTKIRQLLRILHAETPQHKTIVFSQFTTMLDLIQPHLQQSQIGFVRYDGSMRNDAREASLHSLRNDRKTRVLLCSLKCGSLGLNLTAASRVVIIEPFWNPFVEEQAIDRVHRLNQPVDVKVFRLTIRNTVEERILALQERKRQLANAAIEGAGNTVNKLSMHDILNLFRHDAADPGAQHDAEDREMFKKFGGEQRLLDGTGSVAAPSSSARGDAGVVSSNRQFKPGKARLYEEHDVYGRRW